MRIKNIKFAFPFLLGPCKSTNGKSVRHHFLLFSFFRLSQPPQVDLSHATSPTVSNVPHPCLLCLPVNWSPFPVNWSPNEQDHIADLCSPTCYKGLGRKWREPFYTFREIILDQICLGGSGDGLVCCSPSIPILVYIRPAYFLFTENFRT